MSFEELIPKYLVPACTPEQQELLIRMCHAYFTHMDTCNFTGHRTADDFFYLNILDSLLPLFLGHVQCAPGARIIDIGTGGGFPGVPLAALAPEASFLLVDSVGKKLRVIEAVCQAVGVSNVQILHERFELLGHNKRIRETADVVVAKAVAKWPTLLEYALPLVRVGGDFFAYQSTSILPEVETFAKVLQMLGGTLQHVAHYELPEDHGERVIIHIKKIASTPAMYPRSVGMPKKSPLGY